MRISNADIVPTEANLLAACDSFAELEVACVAFMDKVNGRRHRETHRVPAEMLLDERPRLHTLPSAPHAMALGLTRKLGSDQTIRHNSVRYSVPRGWSMPRCGSASRAASSSSSRTSMRC